MKKKTPTIIKMYFYCYLQCPFNVWKGKFSLNFKMYPMLNLTPIKITSFQIIKIYVTKYYYFSELYFFNNKTMINSRLNKLNGATRCAKKHKN